MILSEEHLLLRNTVRKRMIEKDVQEMILKYEKHGAPFAWEFVYEMAELGLTGINIPQEYGGQGADNLSGVIAMIEMSSVWAGGALILGVGNSLASEPLVKFGTQNQKQKWLPSLAEGKILGSFGLTESGRGSDAGSLETLAEHVSATRWRASGEKHFITNAPIASFAVIFARTNREIKNYRGISAFVVNLNRRKNSGLETSAPDQKLGLHAAQMGRIFLNQYPIPGACLVGEVERGFSVALATLSHGRNWITAQCDGLMNHALNLGLEYARNRMTFGALLVTRPAILDLLDEIRFVSDVTKLLLFYSAHLEDNKEQFFHWASLAKLYASENVRTLTQKVQKHIFGGAGYLLESPISRVVADSLVPDIYEGASNIQRDVILKSWLNNRLEIYPKPPFTYLFNNLKSEARELGGQNALLSQNQVRLFQIADIMPLVGAWHIFEKIFSNEWPKEFMHFKDPSIFADRLLYEIKQKWPSQLKLDDKNIMDAVSKHLNG